MAGLVFGHGVRSQDTLKFSVLPGLRSMNQVYPRKRVSRGLRVDDKRFAKRGYGAGMMTDGSRSLPLVSTGVKKK